MKTQIDLEHTYAYPIEQVWFALTDKAAISEWLMKTDDFEPRVGARFRLRAPAARGWRGYVDCEVLEVSPPRRLSYSWVGDERRPPMRVTWTLEPAGRGTRLRLEHTGFVGVGGWMLARLMMGPGWKRMMARTFAASLARRTGGRAGASQPVDGGVAGGCEQ